MDGCVCGRSWVCEGSECICVSLCVCVRVYAMAGWLVKCLCSFIMCASIRPHVLLRQQAGRQAAEGGGRKIALCVPNIYLQPGPGQSRGTSFTFFVTEGMGRDGAVSCMTHVHLWCVFI